MAAVVTGAIPETMLRGSLVRIQFSAHQELQMQVGAGLTGRTPTRATGRTLAHLLGHPPVCFWNYLSASNPTGAA